MIPASTSGAREAGSSPKGRLLFVCTGNTCRSPMAEVIARAEAKRRGWADVEVSSAGTFAYDGQGASVHGIDVAAEHGLDLRDHRARVLDFRQLSRADLVLGMTKEHAEAALHTHPAVRAHVITDYLPAEHPSYGGHVDDPIGGGREAYRATYRLLEVAIRGLFDRLGDVLAAGREE